MRDKRLKKRNKPRFTINYFVFPSVGNEPADFPHHYSHRSGSRSLYLKFRRNNIVKYSIFQLVIPFKRRQHGCVQTQTVNQYTVYRIRELIQVKLTIKKFDLFEIYMRMFPVQKHHPITQMP